MNEKALQDSYNIFKAQGYNKSIEEYKTLLKSNGNALNDSYKLFKSKGYNKSIDDYKVLMGVSGEPPKKKEPTVSPSPSGQKLTSSGTPAKKPSGQSDYLSPESNIGLQSPVDKVDYTAKKEAVKGEYKGYPGKEENTYRVYNNTWQRKMPNQTNWQDVLNEGSVNALNKQFNQTVKYSKAQEKYKGVVEDKKEVAKKELDVKLSTVNSKLIDKSEKVVVPKLKEQFPDFKFASSGTFTDEVKVIAPNNKTITINLDNWTADSDTSEAELLRSFIRDNSNTSRNEAKSEYEEAKKQMEYFDLKPFNPTIKLGEGYGDEQIVTDLNKVVKPEGAPTDIMTADMNLKSARAKLAKESEMAYIDVIDKVRAAAKTSGKIDDNEAKADLAMLKADWKETNAANDYFNDISVQSTEIKKQWTDLQSYVDDVNTKLSTGEISQEQYDAEYVPLMKSSLEDLQIRSSALNNEYTTAQNVNKSIERSAAENLVIQESRGSIAGGVAYGFTKGLTDVLRVATLGSLPKEAQEDLVRAVVGSGTTEEYMSSESRSDLTKVLFSLSRTMGQAVSGGFLGKGASALGAGSKTVLTAETVPFFASSYYEMRDQFDAPEFSGISDMQKVLFSAVYGTASGILEKYGLTKAVSKTPFGKNLTNTILNTAIKGLPKNASEQAIKDAIESSVVNKIKSAGVSSLGAFVVEGATEAAQKATEIGLKESFDILNKDNYFESGTSWNMLSDVIYEGYLGGLGGTMMNVASNGARIATDGISKVLTKDQVGVLDVMTQTEGMSESFDTYLKGLVVSGDVTSEEAGVMSKGFREVKAGFDKIPSDIPVDQKTKAFDLIVERSKIEKEISGKEDNLVVAQKERISAINNELQTISKDAVQKQTTDEGVLQPEGSEVGLQEVGQGDAKQEVITEEGKKEIIPGERAVVSGVEITYPTEDQKSERIASRSTVEFVENASKDLQVEDVNVLSEDLSGEFGVLTAENPLIQPLTDQENKSLNQKAEQWLKDKGYKPRRVTGKYDQGENSFFVPNLSKEDAVEFAKEFNQDSVAHSEGMIYQDGRMNPRVKESDDFSFSEFNPESNMVSVVRTPEGLRTFSIGYDFENKVPMSTETSKQSEVTSKNEVTVDSFQELENQAVKAGDDNRIKVLRAARQVTKALTGVKVFVHNSPEEYKQAIANASGDSIDAITAEETEGRTAGQYVNGEIHLDGTIAKAATVYHEAFHDAILKSGLTVDFAKGLLNIISDKKVKAKVKDFIDQYESGEQNEEMISELGAIMAEAGTELSTTKLHKFKQLINKLAQKLGLPNILPASANRQEVIDFINSMSKSIRGGKVVEAKVSGISSRKKRMTDPVAGNKLFNEPLKDASKIANNYAKKSGIDFTDPERVTKLDEENSKAIASEYDKMKNNPTDPEVKAAYDAMIDETISQYEEIIGNGYVVEVNNEEPYSSSGDMISDLKDNKRMKIFSTESGFGDEPITDQQRKDNPLLQETKFKDVNGVPLLANDLFRFVHDFFGHAKFGNGFGPVGEENAWRIHSAMYSEPARRAMSSETRGQNSWVNFSGVNDKVFELRDKARELRKQGKIDEANDLVGKVYEDMKFADQKVGLMPEWVSETGPYARKKQKADGKKVTSKIEIYGVDFTEDFNRSGISFEYINDVIGRNVPDWLGGDNKKISEIRRYLMSDISYMIDFWEDERKKRQLRLNKSDADFDYLKNRVRKVDERIDKLKNIKSFINDNVFRLSDVNITTDNIETLSSTGRSVKKSKVSANDIAINKAKEKYDLSIKRGNSTAQAIESAINDLKKSDWYVNADDISREDAVRELRSKLGLKEKKAPSVDKITGKPKDKKVIVNEAAALKSQLRLEAKAARESQMDLKQKQRMLVVAVNQMKKSGAITVKQASALAKRLAYVNVDNPIMVERFLGYAEKLFDDADYSAKLDSALELQKKIKKAIKSGKIQASVVAAAKAFSKIDPSMSEDINSYLENASSVFESVVPSRATGLSANLKTAMDIQSVNEYVDAAIEFENNQKKKELMAIYKDLVDSGLITEDMSINDIKELISSIENEQDEKLTPEDKRAYIMAWLGSTANVYRPIIKSMLNGRDPFTGDNVVLSEKQQQIMRDFLKIDVTKMDVREAMFVVEAMDNFITNQITDGLEAVISKYKGQMESKKIADSGFKARAMNTFGNAKSTTKFGRLWSQEMMSIKTMTDLVFRGVNNAQKITKAIGLSAYENGVALANKIWNNDMDSYHKEFGKLKPNGSAFMSAKNIYERGMYAVLKRTIPGDKSVQDAELKRNIKLINDSISVLSKGSEKDQQMAKIYAEVAEKLGINEEGVTMFDIESRTDVNNINAVDWWINKWGDNYSDLSDVSQNVYNTILERDMYYSPVKFSTTVAKEVTVEEALENAGGAFGQYLNYEYDKKSGVLMPSGKKSSMAENRFMDLNFDMNNAKSLKAALVDIKTASAIRQMSGFLNSKDWEKVMVSADDRKIFRHKIDNYILRSRNKSTGSIDNDYAQALDKASRVWASMGAARALGGPTQIFKQSIPVLANTIINSGRFDLITSKEKNDWVSKIGRGISNRGMESLSGFEDANRLMDDAVDSGNAAKILNAFDKGGTFLLKWMLSKPDVFIARSSFISYYKQYMSNNGMSDEINYSNPEEANQDALDYAQRMVDRQQNVSDSDLAGEFMSSNKPSNKIARNLLFPFASFAINQKSRMFTDVSVALSKEASIEDKRLARRSLSALGAEIIVFNSIAYLIKYLTVSVAGAAAPPEEEDKEESAKQLERQWGYTFGNLITNILSPVPILDEAVISASDYLYKKLNDASKSTFGEADKKLKEYNDERELNGSRPITGKEADRWKEDYIEENRFKILAYENKGMGGTYRITYDKLVDLSKSYDLAFNGEFSEERYGKTETKYILKEDRELLKGMWYGNLAYNIAGFPSEYSSINRRIENNIKKKSAISEKKFDTYNEVVEYKDGKDLNKVELFLVKNMNGTKSQSGFERIKDEIVWIDENGGFKNDRQMDKYIEIYNKDGSVSGVDMDKIHKIK